MEFPDLGKHCDFQSCNQLDFLPMKCDACSMIFCLDHIKYAFHSCPSSYKKDVQVPVCPLCNKPVPVAKNELPDIKVGEHIDKDCQSDPAKAKRSSDYHHCSVRRCKQAEFVPVICPNCGLNYCLKHRNPLDHECSSRNNVQNQVPRNKAAMAALNRQKRLNGITAQNTAASSSNQQSSSLALDEAFALALQLSLNDDININSPDLNMGQEELDRRLAEALAQSEDDFATEQLRQREGKKRNCTIA